jgi:phage virion morphogenesis protein
MTEADDLAAIEPWIAGIMAPLQPGQRMLLARRLGQFMRRVNAARVAAGVEPEGEPFTPRKPKKERPPKHARKGRIPIRQRGKRGRMFPRVELARNMMVTPGPDQVELAFRPRIAAVAAIHHFGLVAPVDPRIANSISVRYPARRLLGFAPADSEMIMRMALEWMQERGI